MTYQNDTLSGESAPDTKNAVSDIARRRTIAKRQNSRQAVFLKILAETSCVKTAVRQAGISSATAYRWRRKDAQFRGLWAAALAEGYEQLEMEMLARMRQGTERRHYYGGELRYTETVHNDALALRLLAYHRDTVAATRAAEADQAVKNTNGHVHSGIMREKLNRKLDDMRSRFLARYPQADYGPERRAPVAEDSPDA